MINTIKIANIIINSAYFQNCPLYTKRVKLMAFFKIGWV